MTAGADEAVLTGRVLAGRYAMEERIGWGGMSTVYRATDQTLGRTVAVKVIRYPAAPPDTDARVLRENLRQRFRREAGSAARIPPHPNVVHVYDYGTDPETDADFIVMELLRGRDLKHAMRDTHFADADALRILRGAAAGLGAGHRAGIVHRDVKPANLWLSGPDDHEETASFETVRVLDFGIAKAVQGAAQDDELTTTGLVPHTPAYAAPEQAATTGTVTPATDVYALGLVGYELLARERPFDEVGRARLRAGETVPVPNRGRWQAVPAALRQVIERALEREPAARYPDGAAFAAALAATKQHLATGAAGQGARPESAGDETLLFIPTAAPDGTAPAPGGPALLRTGPEPLPPIEPASAPRAPVAAPAPRRPARSPAHLAWGIGAVLLLALAGWGIARWMSSEPPAVAAPILPNATVAGRPLPELDEQFAPLLHEAAERLAGADTVP